MMTKFVAHFYRSFLYFTLHLYFKCIKIQSTSSYHYCCPVELNNICLSSSKLYGLILHTYILNCFINMLYWAEYPRTANFYEKGILLSSWYWHNPTTLKYMLGKKRSRRLQIMCIRLHTASLLLMMIIALLHYDWVLK